MDLFALVAAPVGALVDVVRVQAAEPDEHVDDALPVLARQLAVQGALVDRLGEQFGDIAAGVR